MASAARTFFARLPEFFTVNDWICDCFDSVTKIPRSNRALTSFRGWALVVGAHGCEPSRASMRGVASALGVASTLGVRVAPALGVGSRSTFIR